MIEEIRERLPVHLRKFIPEEDPRGCWIWQGYRTPIGRPGDTTLGSRKTKTAAHRAIWITLNGPVPQGKILSHTCGNAKGGCVNPAHLEVCTRRDALLREGSQSLPAQYARRSHCKHGHELSPENTYVIPEGHDRAGARLCRTCLRRRNLETRGRHRDRYLEQQRRRYAEDPRVRAQHRRRNRRHNRKKRRERAELRKLAARQERDRLRDLKSTGWMPTSWDRSIDKPAGPDSETTWGELIAAPVESPEQIVIRSLDREREEYLLCLLELVEGRAEHLEPELVPILQRDLERIRETGRVAA